MTRYSKMLLSTVVAAALAATSTWADDTTPPAAKSVAELIAQLDAEDFKERQAASTKLTQLGKEAIEPLQKVATSENAEASTRALEILRQHFESENAELKAAAKTALQSIADMEKGSAARRAAEIITPKPMTTPQPVPAFGGGIRILPGGIAPVPLRMRVEAGGGLAIGGAGVKRMSVKSVNGVKEIEAVEDDRTVTINDDPDKGIKVKVVSKKDGKEETKEYEAKNAEELKTKHPEGHKIYEQYAQKDLGIRIEAFPAVPGVVPGIAPGFAPAFPIAPPIAVAPRARAMILRDPDVMAEQLDKAQKQLTIASEGLKKIVESADNQAEIKKTIEALEQAVKELNEVKAKVQP